MLDASRMLSNHRLRCRLDVRPSNAYRRKRLASWRCSCDQPPKASTKSASLAGWDELDAKASSLGTKMRSASGEATAIGAAGPLSPNNIAPAATKPTAAAAAQRAGVATCRTLRSSTATLVPRALAIAAESALASSSMARASLKASRADAEPANASSAASCRAPRCSPRASRTMSSAAIPAHKSGNPGVAIRLQTISVT